LILSYLIYLVTYLSYTYQILHLLLNQKPIQNGPVWRSPGKISEEDKIEIIQTGFQLQAEGKISLKKYYEGVSEANSLFQLRGYRIKYESIRRIKLYSKLTKFSRGKDV